MLGAGLAGLARMARIASRKIIGDSCGNHTDNRKIVPKMRIVAGRDAF